MVSVIGVVVIVVVTGGVLWMRRSRRRAQTDPLPSVGIPPETLALEAFTHGNSCLAEGKFAEAVTAFHRARELDPKRPHVADRLAEVERRQQLVREQS
jgi:hypothetical protein